MPELLLIFFNFHSCSTSLQPTREALNVNSTSPYKCGTKKKTFDFSIFGIQDN